MTGVSQFVSGDEKNCDASVAVKLIGEGLKSKTTLVGVADSMQQYQVLLGNRKWLELNGFELSNEVNQIITSNEGSGQTVILVGINGMYHDILCLASFVQVSFLLYHYIYIINGRCVIVNFTFKCKILLSKVFLLYTMNQ